MTHLLHSASRGPKTLAAPSRDAMEGHGDPAADTLLRVSFSF